jgi:hypothetical protein
MTGLDKAAVLKALKQVLITGFFHVGPLKKKYILP